MTQQLHSWALFPEKENNENVCSYKHLYANA